MLNPNLALNAHAGYENHRLEVPTTAGIYECNENCSCDSRCGNRIVQHGMYLRLEVFKTVYKGWGIRAINSIPKGSFLCIYTGSVYDEETAEKEAQEFGDEYQANLDYIEVVENPKEGYEEFAAPFTDDEAETVPNHPLRFNPQLINQAFSQEELKRKIFRRTTTGFCNDLIRLDNTVRLDLESRKNWLKMRKYFSEEEPYVMDAKKKGNLARYFNHSCDPNVFVQNVFVKTHDPRFPEVAFFTKKNINAGEELTWDYGYMAGTVESKELYCYCGSTNCRVRLL